MAEAQDAKQERSQDKVKEKIWGWVEEAILTGQIPQERVPGLLAEDHDFAAWYPARMAGRRPS